jgi:hypothetical protein
LAKTKKKLGETCFSAKSHHIWQNFKGQKPKRVKTSVGRFSKKGLIIVIP